MQPPGAVKKSPFTAFDKDVQPLKSPPQAEGTIPAKVKPGTKNKNGYCSANIFRPKYNLRNPLNKN